MRRSDGTELKKPRFLISNWISLPKKLPAAIPINVKPTPSVIVERASNILVNPLHSSLGRLTYAILKVSDPVDPVLLTFAISSVNTLKEPTGYQPRRAPASFPHLVFSTNTFCWSLDHRIIYCSILFKVVEKSGT